MPTPSPVPREQALRAIMSGERRGIGASTVRLATGIAEPFYASAMRLRNLLYEKGLKKSHRLARPVISIGNITTGGTGKTPVVEFLARQLRDSGRNVCVLSRGYKSISQPGDEQRMLDESLNTGDSNRVRLIANPNRVAAAEQALRDEPAIDVFLLDDGFQHRAVRRDFDIVLINARDPFGYGHVLPRGMLREPLSGLRRADAFIVTHVDQVSLEGLSKIEATLLRRRPNATIYRCTHAHVGLSSNSGSAIPITELGGKRFFLFCGIGDPLALNAQMSAHGSNYAGHHFFSDHYDFTASDINQLRSEAAAAGAQTLVTTAKDWVKIPAASFDVGMPIWRLDLAIEFAGDAGGQLIRQVESVIQRVPASRE